MASDPVTVWVANGRDGCYAWETKPYIEDGIWNGHSSVMVVDPLAKYVPPGQCREYVMIPADQYREMQRPQPAELSPVAKLIAELATRFNHDNRMSVSDACSLAAAHINGAMSISAAYEIESEVK